MAQRKNNRKQAGRHRRRRRWIGKRQTVIAAVACTAVVILAIALTVFFLFQKNGNQGADTLDSETHELNPHVEEYERMDADYEQWLAASVITCISMNSPDFELEEVYASTRTAPDNKMESQGIYVIYRSGEESKCIQAKPLEHGRTGQAGTKDVYSELTGYASFDEVSADVIDTSLWHNVDVQDINTLIEQSERVTLYEN